MDLVAGARTGSSGTGPRPCRCGTGPTSVTSPRLFAVTIALWRPRTRSNSTARRCLSSARTSPSATRRWGSARARRRPRGSAPAPAATSLRSSLGLAARARASRRGRAPPRARRDVAAERGQAAVAEGWPRSCVLALGADRGHRPPAMLRSIPPGALGSATARRARPPRAAGGRDPSPAARGDAPRARPRAPSRVPSSSASSMCAPPRTSASATPRSARGSPDRARFGRVHEAGRPCSGGSRRADRSRGRSSPRSRSPASAAPSGRRADPWR